MAEKSSDKNSGSVDRKEIAREAGLSYGSDRTMSDQLDQVNDTMIDDDLTVEDNPTFSAENEALANYEALQKRPAGNMTAPRDFTDEDAHEIAEGIKEAGVVNPHKGERGEPEPKHHMDHM